MASSYDYRLSILKRLIAIIKTNHSTFDSFNNTKKEPFKNSASEQQPANKKKKEKKIRVSDLVHPSRYSS